MIVVDFETEAIDGNTTFRPPVPVGVSIYNPEKGPPQYFAWGHPEGNNSTYEQAKRVLGKIAASKHEVLFHNAKFDLAVMERHFGITIEDPTRVYDTQYDLFLTDPYAASFSLKPSAERVLGRKPEERDELREWILANVAEARRKPSEWGAFICRGPASLVGRYANADTELTWNLFSHLHPEVLRAQLVVAYHREQRLLPILMSSELRGIRVDHNRLEGDISNYRETLLECDRRIIEALGGHEFNIDSPKELADALERAGLVDAWVTTEKGERSTARSALEKCVKDKSILTLLSYRGALSTCLTTFAIPWLEQVQRNGDGRIHTEWNQVRGDRGGKNSKGTRTGRLSSMSPNFQNVPNELNFHVAGLPDLPRMRRYLLPEEGHVWLKRDFHSQEMRILAHFSEGRLFREYQEDPKADAHEVARVLIKEQTGMDLPRKYVKITAFGIVYGEGAGSLAARLGVTYDEARNLRNVYLATFPEVEELANETRKRGRNGQAIRTWGGRLYHAEPPKLIKGQMREFSYKLLNYLIQGSAADCTKQAIIDWDGARGETEVFLATVHDEVNISAPPEDAERAMAVLNECMRDVQFDLPMLSEGYRGPNWEDIEECE